MPNACQQTLLEQVRVVPLSEIKARCRFQQLLDKHHYLGSIKPVGEQLYYVALDARGGWLALLLFNAASKHLKDRDRWIGWTRSQRERRLSFVVNNSRFLILPSRSVPNLGSRVLALTLERLSADWQERYNHPVLIAETFVDPEQFCGAVYTASNWVELGLTQGCGRHRRDYYLEHDKPKRLFVRQLTRNARRSLSAEHLKAPLAAVEAKATPICTYKIKEIEALSGHFKSVPEYRKRYESYPIWSLLTLILLAMLCEAPRGQKDLAKFARRLTQAQRRTLGFRENPQGRYPAPGQSTFSRLLKKVDGAKVNQTLLAIQEKLRGKPPQEDLIAVDGKEPRHGTGDAVLSAVTVPSQFYLGSALVDTKTNEIPVARELFGQMDLEGRKVALDALHTQDHTARDLVMERGADYLLTVKNNQPTLRKNIEKIAPVASAGFSPLDPHAHPCTDPRT